MDIKDYLQVLIPKLWVLILGAILAAVACYYVATTYTNWPIYEASGTLLIQGSTSGEPIQDTQDLIRSQSTLAALAKRAPLTQNVVDSLGLHMTEQELADLIRVRTLEQTSLVEVYAINKDPQKAQSIAEAMVLQLHTYRGSNIETTVLDVAERPKAPLTSSYLLILVAAAIGGVIAVGGVLFAEYFNDIIRHERDIVQNLAMPVLGQIDEVGTTHVQMQEMSYQAYQWLFANIYVKHGRMPNSILITSPQFCNQQSEFVSMFIQCNLRRKMPMQLSHNFTPAPDHDSVPNRLGTKAEGTKTERPTEEATEEAAEEATEEITDVTTTTLTGPMYNLDVVEKSLNLTDMSEKQRSQIVDAPPVLSSVNTVMMSKKFESVLMVLDAHKTKISDTKKAAQLLNDAGARVIGAVLLT